MGGNAHRAVAGGDGARLQDGNFSSVHNARITEANIEMLVLFKNVVVNNANGELFGSLTGFEDQSALSKLIVWTCISSAIFCPIVHLCSTGKETQLNIYLEELW